MGRHELGDELNSKQKCLILVFTPLNIMIRINEDTPIEQLGDIKIGDLVTDTFSKTGLVERIDISDDGLYRIYEFSLVTGRVITTKR